MENIDNTNTELQPKKGAGIGTYLLIALGFIGVIYLLKLIVDLVMK